MFNLKKLINIKASCVLLIAIISIGTGRAENDVSLYLDNFENRSNQLVSIGRIDDIRIARDNAMFILGPGDIALFDFGWDKPSAMVFRGRGKFI